MTRSSGSSGGYVRPPRTMDADAIRSWLDLALRTCESARELIDTLNVFPVPDADTGTNVVLTLRSAMSTLVSMSPLAHPGWDVSVALQAAADAALKGARGNSGLLLSQVFAAFAEVASGCADPTSLRPTELTQAYERMAATTWAAVSHPVTGTLLTVAADAAGAASDNLASSTGAEPASLITVSSAAAFAAQESVVETGGLGHGVVDAGGAALMLVLASLADVLADDGDTRTVVVARQMLDDLVAGGAHQTGHDLAEGQSSGEFEVMYLLEATSEQADTLRAELDRIGDCVGVVGTADVLGLGLFQVHVHTDTPRLALPRQGRARQVCIHRLRPPVYVPATDEPPLPRRIGAGAQVVSLERFAAARARRQATQADSLSASAVPAVRGRLPAHHGPHNSAHNNVYDNQAREAVGIIACTRAPGLIETLARTGAVVVLDPDRDGILRAVGDLGSTQILVLPCDEDTSTAAHAATRALAARAAARVNVTREAGSGTVPGTMSGTMPRISIHAHPAGMRPERTIREAIHLLVADTDDEARTLAAAVACESWSAHAEVIGGGLSDHSDHSDHEHRHASGVRNAVNGEQVIDAAFVLAETARHARQAAAALRTYALVGGEAEPNALAELLPRLLRVGDELVTVLLGAEAHPDSGAIIRQVAEQTDLDIEVIVHASGQRYPTVLIGIE